MPIERESCKFYFNDLRGRFLKFVRVKARYGENLKEITVTLDNNQVKDDL